MAPHNSGVNLFVWDQSMQIWTLLEEAFLEEARTYSWRCVCDEPIRITMQGIPLQMTKATNGWDGIFETPFQSGLIHFSFYRGNELNEIENYVYPDNRKMTLKQYVHLLQEILDEAMICFQKDGLEADVSATGFTRNRSILQWNYIEQQIIQLRSIFRKIQSHPLRVLQRGEAIVKREQIKQVTPGTLSWMERYGESYGGSPSRLPSHLKSSITEESFNVYENRLILTQLNELQWLLRGYVEVDHPVIKQKSIQYSDWISNWKRAVFLKRLKPHFGPVKISQAFRKHPAYRLWFRWFQDLYNFKDINFDIEKRLPLKDTYQLYEFWCFMRIVRCLRELNLLEETSEIFTHQEDYFYLSLSENKESVIKLKNGAKLTYQKIIQVNTKPYYSYTQRMIPDIVIEKDNSLFILDPKYRIPANLSTALGEMHKYRDGILHRDSDQKVVEEVYILTPGKAKMPVEKNFYEQEFQQKYKMGAFCFKPDGDSDEFKNWVMRVFS